MGRKTKIGKQRKDRFYQLAKETGYRSRAAFKLIQLNRKFEFLQRSKVLIDLCSAPGGWLQVAQKFMPVSSVIMGVDLVPIKPLPNVMTFQGDITTQQCRSMLKKELKTWKADVVLNDGAPNVGKNWIHDAYAQVRLTLSAIQLASEFLMRGGWFVTKVFRSKDYNALIWLLGKLFKKVHATKPQASRHESAEIFVVCEKFLAPDRIDPKFFDPTYLFEDIALPSDEKKKKAELLKPLSKQKRPKAEGYADGDYTLYHKLNASEFITKSNHIELLSDSNEIVLDVEAIANHPLTNDDIKEYCKDLKVIGRKEILQLMAWRRKLKADLYPPEKPEPKLDSEGVVIEPIPEENEDDEDDEELTALKRKKKKILKERRKLNERMSLKMVLNNNELIEEDDMELFQLRHLKNRSALDRFQDISIDDLDDQFPNYSDDEEDEPVDPKLKKVFFDRDGKDDYDFEDRFKDPDEVRAEEEEAAEEAENLEESEEQILEDDDIDNINDGDEEEEEGAGLLLDLDERPRNVKDRMFFERGIFNDEEFGDEIDVKVMAEDKKKRPKERKEKEAKSSRKVRFQDSDDDDKSDEDDEEGEEPKNRKEKNKLSEKCQLNVKLSPQEMALGSIMIKSGKTRRDIMDMAWNRYTHADHDFLPSWFQKDEEIFFQKPLPVPQSTLNEYQQKLTEIDAHPIKRIAEANARKRKRAQHKLERARKRAEALTDAPDMSEKEKMATIKNLYKKAMKGEKKKEVTYVVAKKGKVNKRPAGLKGRYKLVDGRMKKDKLKQKRQAKDQKKKKGKKPAKTDKPPKGARLKRKAKF